MAHYVALHGARFRCSHDHNWVPIHALEKYLLDLPLRMNMKRAEDGSRVMYHSCMDYLCRPLEMEDCCVYNFYSNTKIMSIREIEKQDIEAFPLTTDHPLSYCQSVVYRQTKAVPSFAWNWLPPTHGFNSSIFEPFDPQTTDYKAKEFYSQRFLMLFCPFRTLQDLQKNNSYLCKLQELMQNGDISDEFQMIADNILNIHNSLNSTMVPNWLTEGTEMPDESLEGPIECCDDKDDMQKMLDDIANTLAPTAETDQLHEESTEIFPSIANKDKNNLNNPPTDPVTFSAVNDVFDLSITSSDGNLCVNIAPSERFTSKISHLNALVMQRFLTPKITVSRAPGENLIQQDLWKAEATGTWESIVAWGRENNLDAEQQTAFEILAATFVLNFLEESTEDVSLSQALKDQYQALKKLARCKDGQKEPLCMFITGRAGAGKCKSTSGYR